MNTIRYWTAGALLLAGTQSAIADEVWNSTYGTVIYAEDVGVTANWTYEYNCVPGILFIPGLAGIYSNRGSYEGYWAQNDSNQRCDYERPGLEGKPTYYWGKFHITFVDKDFPSRWRAQWGFCDNPPTGKWEGSPVVGNAQ